MLPMLPRPALLRRRIPGKQNNKVNAGEASFLQQQSCMFGHKQLPAWASCVSSELARILHQKGARVIIDDILFHGPASEGAAGLQRTMDMHGRRPHEQAGTASE